MKSIFMIRAAHVLSAVAICSFAAAAPARAMEPASRADADEKAGWLDSGSRLSLGSLPVRELEPPPGRFEVMAPAGKVRALLARGDSIWVGAEGGLFIWIPGSDTVVAVEGSGLTAVSSLASGDNGEIWVGGESGLSIRNEWGWDRFTRRSHPFFSGITDIRAGEGKKIWISTWGSGCGYVAGDSLTILSMADSLLDDRVTCAVEQSGNTIWFGTESGVCRADSFSWTSMRYGSRIPVGRVRDMILGEDGGLFIAVARQGVARYSLGRVSRYGPRQGLPDRDIYRFGLDQRAGVWAAGNRGISIWDGSGWTPLRIPGVSLARHTFSSVTHDLEGNALLGTAGGLVARVSRDSYLEKDLPRTGPAAMIGHVVSSGNALLMTGGDAVYLYDGGFNPVKLPGDWFEGTVTGIVPEARGGLWLSTRFGILHYSGGSWDIFDRRQGLPTEHFTCAAPGRDGTLWFGTFDSGVLRLTRDGWTHYVGRSGLPDERISSMTADREGTVWISTMSGKVARFTGKSWEQLDLPGASSPAGSTAASADSMMGGDPAVRILHSSGGGRSAAFPPVTGLDGSGRCMICTSAGILFQSEAGWRLYDLPVGGAEPRPTAVMGAVDGTVWLGTGGAGAFVLQGEKWMQVDCTNGLGGNIVTSIDQDPSGTVWIGTRDGGVTRYVAGQY